MVDNPKKFSLKTILTAGGLALGVATAVAALTSNIYSTKTEVAQVKEEVKAEMSDVELKTAQTGWKIQTLGARIKNIERRQIQMSENVTKLLVRFRVQPVEPPYLVPVPAVTQPYGDVR